MSFNGGSPSSPEKRDLLSVEQRESFRGRRGSGAYSAYALDSSPAKLTEYAQRNKVLVASSAELCATLKTRVYHELDNSVQSIIKDFPEAVTRNESPLKSAVGIILKKNVVDFFLPGVPASRVLRKGDEIVEIDGMPCNEHSAADMLIGCDIPGSSVNIKYRASAAVMNTFLPDNYQTYQTLVLKRLPSEMLSDRRNMLELLRSLKVGAVERGDHAAGAVVDKTTDLWRKMLLSDEALRSRTCVAAEQMGETIKTIVHETTGMLNELQALGDLEPYAHDLEHLQSTAMLGHREAASLREQTAAQLKALEERDAEIGELQHKYKSVSGAHKDCDEASGKLRQRLSEVEGARALLASTLQGARTECAAARSRAVELEILVQQLQQQAAHQQEMLGQSQHDLQRQSLLLSQTEADKQLTKSVAQAAQADAEKQLLAAKSHAQQERHMVAAGVIALATLKEEHAKQVARLQEHTHAA